MFDLKHVDLGLLDVGGSVGYEADRYGLGDNVQPPDRIVVEKQTSKTVRQIALDHFIDSWLRGDVVALQNLREVIGAEEVDRDGFVDSGATLGDVWNEGLEGIVDANLTRPVMIAEGVVEIEYDARR